MADTYFIAERKGAETNLSKMTSHVKANTALQAANSKSAQNKRRLSPVESQMTLKRKYPDERHLPQRETHSMNQVRPKRNYPKQRKVSQQETSSKTQATLTRKYPEENNLHQCETHSKNQVASKRNYPK